MLKRKTVRYILFHLRIAPDEAHAVEMMNNLIKQNKLLPIPDKNYLSKLKKVGHIYVYGVCAVILLMKQNHFNYLYTKCS